MPNFAAILNLLQRKNQTYSMTEIKKWKTVSSEYLIRRPWLTARPDVVELPDGRINPEFYVLEYPSWVNVTAITEDGHFVMIEQYRHGLGSIQTELCAGVVEDGEDPESAARRELAEESGYTGGEWRLLTVISANPSTTNNLTYCFLAEGVRLTGTQHLDATEDVAVRLLTRSEIDYLLQTDQIKQALMATPLLRYLYMPHNKINPTK